MSTVSQEARARFEEVAKLVGPAMLRNARRRTDPGTEAKVSSLNMTKLKASTKNNLINQGFGKLDEGAKARYAAPLRFTPGVGTALIVAGLVLESPVWLGTMAFVALTGTALPKGMLLDLVYNMGVRHLFRAPPLPATPKPRRFSYLLSAILLAGSALSFHYDFKVLGHILGGMVATGGTILTFSLWCLGSWFYRRIFGQAVDESVVAQRG